MISSINISNLIQNLVSFVNKQNILFGHILCVSLDRKHFKEEAEKFKNEHHLKEFPLPITNSESKIHK